MFEGATSLLLHQENINQYQSGTIFFKQILIVDLINHKGLERKKRKVEILST